MENKSFESSHPDETAPQHLRSVPSEVIQQIFKDEIKEAIGSGNDVLRSLLEILIDNQENVEIVGYPMQDENGKDVFRVKKVIVYDPDDGRVAYFKDVDAPLNKTVIDLMSKIDQTRAN